MVLANFFHGLAWLLQTSGGNPNKSMDFLFAGFVVVWALLLGYIFSLVRRQKRLEAEIAMLKQMEKEK